MSTLRAAIGICALLVIGTVLAASAQAQTVGSVTKKTTVTINHPMEVPGGTVLQPGTYIFRLVDMAANRNVMRITNEDDTKVVATFIAIPDYRLKETDNPVVEYGEAVSGQPVPLRAWFYAGEVGGLEFVYPRKRAMELAELTHEYVPAEATEAPGQDMKNEPLVAITPEGKEEPMEEAYQRPVQVEQPPPAPIESSQTQPTTTPTETAQTLPKTASPAPLIAVFGGAFMAMGLGLRRRAKQNS